MDTQALLGYCSLRFHFRCLSAGVEAASYGDGSWNLGRVGSCTGGSSRRGREFWSGGRPATDDDDVSCR